MYDQNSLFVQANNNALLIFPGTVHSEPHEQISWVECEYVIDDYGGLFLVHLLCFFGVTIIMSMFVLRK